MASKPRSSKRWQKYQNAIEKVYQKRREQTKTFLHTTANKLFKLYDCIGIGDYTPQGNGITTKMRRAMNNRSLIGRFKEVLSWTAEKSGKTFLIYDEKGTTRTCSCCKTSLDQGLHPSIREWVCPHCQAVHIRDENAAQNGLNRVLRDLEINSEAYASQVSGSDLVQVVERWAWCVLPSGVHVTSQG